MDSNGHCQVMEWWYVKLSYNQAIFYMTLYMQGLNDGYTQMK